MRVGDVESKKLLVNGEAEQPGSGAMLQASVSLPLSLLLVPGVREAELPALLRHALATDLYRRGLLSLGKAAEVAGVQTHSEMMSLLAHHEVWLRVDEDGALDDAGKVREALSDASR